jgi:hypothetical protein
MVYALVDYALNITKVAPDEVIVHATSTPFDWAPFLPPIIAAVVSAIIATVTALIIARSQRELQEISFGYQETQLHLTSMLDVFKILNSYRHRLAREIIYCAYRLYKNGNAEIFEKEPYHTAAAMVSADMDQVGLLIDDGLLDERMFLKAYWNTVLLTWKAPEGSINYERLKIKGYEGL